MTVDLIIGIKHTMNKITIHPFLQHCYDKDGSDGLCFGLIRTHKNI